MAATTIVRTALLDRPVALLYMLLLFILLLSLHGSTSTTAEATDDMITAAQPLSGQRKLVSQGGKFALGFYQSAGNITNNFFIHILYIASTCQWI